MNNANKSVSARTAVDTVNSSMLLLQKKNDRFSCRMEEAYKWKEELTPHGKKLIDEIFKNVDIVNIPFLSSMVLNA